MAKQAVSHVASQWDIWPPTEWDMWSPTGHMVPNRVGHTVSNQVCVTQTPDLRCTTFQVGAKQKVVDPIVGMTTPGFIAGNFAGSLEY